MSIPDSAPDLLGAALAEYRSYLVVERGLARNTVAAYTRDLRRYLAFLAHRGFTDLRAVDEPTVRAFAEALGETNAGGQRLAAASRARAIAAVRSFHRFAFEEGLADVDPAEEVKAVRVAAGLPKALTEAEVLALLSAVAGDDARALRDRAVLETLYAGGLRISELVALDRRDLDLASGLLRVFGKGSKERVVPVGRAAREALTRYLGLGRPRLVGRVRPAGDPVFLNQRGGRLSRQSCWAIVRRAGVRAGLGERISPHALRHSCATHMVEHGADIRVVQELLGHASLSTTQVYTKVTAARLRAVYDAAHPRARSGIRQPGASGTRASG